jgi:hypothetical protein
MFGLFKQDKNQNQMAEKKEFPLAQLHTDALVRHQAREVSRKRDPKNHLQQHYELDVKGSYALSMENCKTKEAKAAMEAHIQSVLAAGACKFDR